MMWNHWKIFDKMTEDLNCDLFVGPKWPGNWASGANIQHTSKSSSNWHVHQDWCETSGQFFEKMIKDRNFDLFGGPKWPKNWASEAHILHIYKSTWNEHVKQYVCETTSGKFFWKWPNTRDLSYFGAQNGREIGPSRHIFCTSLKVAPMHI